MKIHLIIDIRYSIKVVKTKSIISYLYFFCVAVFIYIPFHAVVSTLLISVIGGKLPVKGIKDLTILIAAIPLIYVAYTYRKKIKSIDIGKSYLYFIVALIALGGITLGTYYQPGIQIVAGYIANYRYLGFFVLCLGISYFFYLKNREAETNKIIKILLIASFVVVAFGFLQVFFLPKDFLSIFGYSEATIKPYQTIDNNESFIRILSTLRGPNPLGAYLALLAPLAVYYFKKIRTRRTIIALIYGVFFLSTLYGSQSRSAWIGLMAGLATYIFLSFKSKKILAFITCAILPLIALGYIFRNSYFIQNTIFHRDPNESGVVDSDDQRIASLKYAIDQINEKPFGHGVGASGPASNYGPKPVIIENYYLDMAYQIGWFGMLLFLGLITSVGYSLLKQKTDLSNAVFSGLVAISVIALFWPVWTDETVALTWWGLVGLILSSDIVQKVKKR